MNSHVVVQFKDSAGRTVIRWYDDLHEAERLRPIATAGPAHAHMVEAEADNRVVDDVERVSGLLVQDPFQDLSYITTHTRDGDGYVVPVNGVPA